MTKDMIDEITKALVKVGIEFTEIWITAVEDGIGSWQYLQCNVRFKSKGGD
jgi:hypothetical protein